MYRSNQCVEKQEGMQSICVGVTFKLLRPPPQRRYAPVQQERAP
jgi:hypothetical protein